jgi:hypothetical protein
MGWVAGFFYQNHVRNGRKNKMNLSKGFFISQIHAEIFLRICLAIIASAFKLFAASAFLPPPRKA